MAEISNHQIYRKKSQSKHVSRFSFHFLLLFLSFFFLRNFLFFCFYCKTKKMKKKKRKNLSVFALSRFLFKYAKMVAARCANQQTHTHKTDYAQIKTAYSGSSIDQCVCVCVYSNLLVVQIESLKSYSKPILLPLRVFFLNGNFVLLDSFTLFKILVYFTLAVYSSIQKKKTE